CLVLNRCFQTPLVVATSHFDPFIAILDNDAIDLFSIEVEDILRLAGRFFRAWLFDLKKSQVSENAEGDDRQSDSGPPIHKPANSNASLPPNRCPNHSGNQRH